MRTQWLVAVTSASLVAICASLPGAAEEHTAKGLTLAVSVPAAGACLTEPTVDPIAPSPVPLEPCGFCTGVDFCPREGVRCSWQGTCEKGPDRCCHYSCQCDATCTSVSQLEEACAIQVPTCPQCPPRTVCQVSYCGAEGIRCTFNNTCGAGGCCNYDCAPDATCTLPDPVPPNAC